MQVDTQQLQDDPTSHCWSFGSINHPSSQSRKISIGVMVDSIPKKTSEASKEGDIEGLNAESIKNVSHLAQGKGKLMEMATTKETKRTEATEPANSPWISTRQKATTSDTVPYPVRIPDLPASGRKCKLDGSKDAAPTHSLLFSTKDTSVLESDDDVRRNKFNGVSYERKGKTDGTKEAVQEFTFATVQNVRRSDEEVLKDKLNTTENGRTETLRLKLQEILGTVSSPNYHCSKSPTCELGANTSEPDKEFDKMGEGEAVVKPRWISAKQENKFDQMADNDHYSKSPACEFGANTSKTGKTFDQMGDSVFKPKWGSDKQKPKFVQMHDKQYKLRQNSDTIETDSDSPDNRVRRPVTRSVTRKKAPTKVQKKTTRSVQLFGYKLRHQGKNIHSCKGGSSRRLHGTVISSSPYSSQQKNDRKNSRVEPRRLFHEREMEDKIQKVTHGSETSLPAQRTSSFVNKMRDHSALEKKKGDSHNTPPRNEKDNQDVDFSSPENIDQQEEIGLPSARQQEHIVSPLVRNAVNLQGQQEDIDRPPVWKWNDVNLQDLPSPTLGINTPASSASLSSMPKTERTGEVHGLEVPQRKNSDCDDDARMKFSDAVKKLKDALDGKASPSMEGIDSASFNSEDAETSLSEPSSDNGHWESFQEVLPDRCRESWTLFPETSTRKKMMFIPRPAKRLRNHAINVQLNHINATSPSIEGNGEIKGLSQSSEYNQVDGLTRALELFALELEKLKSKIKSVTSKKSSEILMSVAKDVHLKLQNVEFQIQTDMGKLKNLSTLKRKRMETRFIEKQEKLQLIYETFKEQVNQHLQDCKSAFEGLETDHLEFKGTLERRKASHQKLLLQAEGAIETILNDAQRKITATHELARGKMLQLKQVLALCLKEGILS